MTTDTGRAFELTGPPAGSGLAPPKKPKDDKDRYRERVDAAAVRTHKAHEIWREILHSPIGAEIARDGLAVEARKWVMEKALASLRAGYDEPVIPPSEIEAQFPDWRVKVAILDESRAMTGIRKSLPAVNPIHVARKAHAEAQNPDPRRVWHDEDPPPPDEEDYGENGHSQNPDVSHETLPAEYSDDDEPDWLRD